MYTWTKIDDLNAIVDFIETQCSGKRLNEERLHLIKLLTDEYYNSKKIEINNIYEKIYKPKITDVDFIFSKIYGWIELRKDDGKFVTQRIECPSKRIREVMKKDGLINQKSPEEICKILSKGMDKCDFSGIKVGELSDLKTPEFKERLNNIRERTKIIKDIEFWKLATECNAVTIGIIQKKHNDFKQNLTKEMQERINELKEIKHKKDIADEFMKNENDFEDGYIAGKVNELECWIDKIKKM